MPQKERVTVPGKNLVEKIQDLVRDKNVRRVCLRDEEKALLEIPANIGDPAAPAAALGAPVLAAIRAFSTLVNECTIEVERVPARKRS